MIQPPRRDFHTLDIELVAAVDFRKFPRGMHQSQIHRKVRTGELRLKHLTKAVAAKILGWEAEKAEVVLRQVKRPEERDALNVVPVIVSDEDMSAKHVVAFDPRPLIAERPQAGAAIENDPRAGWRDEFGAGSIAAIAPHSAVERGDGAAHAIENQFCNVAVHRRRFVVTAGRAPAPRQKSANRESFSS